MNDFRKLNLPKRHTLCDVGVNTDYNKTKWFCSVRGSDAYYLHRDLKLHNGTSSGVEPEGLYDNDSELKVADDAIDEYYTGFFDSEEEALAAYNKYYYLHAQEPGH